MMATPEIPDQLVEATARTLRPHLWDGRHERALNRSPRFTPEQARAAAEDRRDYTLVEVRAVLEAAWPHLHQQHDGRPDTSSIFHRPDGATARRERNTR